jgi:hypothetical protein
MFRSGCSIQLIYKFMGQFDVYTESELLEVRVPMVFLVAGCFLAAQ